MAAPYKAEFIKIPVAEGSFQTMPTEPEKRLRDDEIRVEKCTEADSREIAEGFYKTFPPAFFDKMEPRHLRPPSDETRIARLAKRLQPTMSEPLVCWTKAVHVPSNTIVGAAGWNAPGLPLISVLSRPAVAFYGFQARMGWSDEEVEEMWAHVDDEKWNGQFAADDEHRKKLLGDTPHWYLAPLYTLPEFQGRGVGMKLMRWAIEQADATSPPTPMYLESAPSARAVYLHCGFEAPDGEPKTMIRWGPRKVGVVDGDKKAAEVGEKAKVVSVDVVAKEMEAELVH